jgi:hypothetical protein
LIQYLFFSAIYIITEHRRTKNIDENWMRTFIVSLIVIYYFPLGIGRIYDRYLLFLLPLLMMVVTMSTININKTKLCAGAISITLVIISLYGALTIGVTHDYLEWNRVRWEALRNLMQEEQISPNRIDGGFEFNGWYLYDPKKRPRDSWWVDKDDYVVSFGPLSGYEEVKQYTFRRWLPFRKDQILILYRSPDEW